MVTRREKENLAMRESIIEAAKRVIQEDGFEHLSIRKIAKQLDYAPSIIYHYFKNKDELMHSVMQSGYQKIVKAVSDAYHSDKSKGLEKLQLMTRAYIQAALEMSDEFLKAQLNQSEIGLKHTASLFKGAIKEKSALQILALSIEQIPRDIPFDEEQLELRAQMIAVSTLGLIVKLIIEKNLTKSQKKRLINNFVEEILVAIATA
jgi:AcrR family transcriptional regulator